VNGIVLSTCSYSTHQYIERCSSILNRGLTTKEFQLVRRKIISNIMATDMSKHKFHIASFQKRLENLAQRPLSK